MAFMINPTYLQGFKVKETREVLFLERTDKEAPSLSFSIPKNAEISDWPTFQKSISYTDFNMNMVGYTDAFRLRGYNRISNLVRRCALFHVLHSVYPKLARCGVEFLCSYKQIYVTRLHAAILSTLLGKDVYLINNSYGKNIQFYSTWLHDADNVTLISNVS
jgi:pyruvyl transferase EpsO